MLPGGSGTCDLWVHTPVISPFGHLLKVRAKYWEFSLDDFLCLPLLPGGSLKGHRDVGGQVQVSEPISLL